MAFDRVIDVKEGEVHPIDPLVIIMAVAEEVVHPSHVREETEAIEMTATVIGENEEPTDLVILKNELRWDSGGTFLFFYFSLPLTLSLFPFTIISADTNRINLRNFGLHNLIG